MHMEKITPPSSSPRVAALLRTVAAFERDDIEKAVDCLIALLDACDGDADLEDDDPDACLAGDDGTAPFMTYFGLRAGSEWEDAEREPDGSEGEAFTWPEAIYQPSCMAGGIVCGLHDEDERADVAPEWPAPAANDVARRASCLN